MCFHPFLWGALAGYPHHWARRCGDWLPLPKQRQRVSGVQPCHWATGGYFWASWKNEASRTSVWQCQLVKLCFVMWFLSVQRGGQCVLWVTERGVTRLVLYHLHLLLRCCPGRSLWLHMLKTIRSPASSHFLLLFCLCFSAQCPSKWESLCYPPRDCGYYGSVLWHFLYPDLKGAFSWSSSSLWQLLVTRTCVSLTG